MIKSSQYLEQAEVRAIIAASGIGRRESGVRSTLRNPPNGYQIALAKLAAAGRASYVPKLGSDPDGTSGFSVGLAKLGLTGRR